MKSIIEYTLTKKNNAIYLTPKNYSKVLFFMHGLGDCADSFIDVFTESQIAPSDFKIVLLNAEKSPVTINGGMMMQSWYDIKSLDSIDDSKKSVSEEDVKKSANRVMKYVEEELITLDKDYKKVYFGGFSQGGCMSLYMGLSLDIDFGGIICLSGLLFPFVKYDKLKKRDIPLFIAHGKYDGVIPLNLAQLSFTNILSDNFNSLSYNTYDMDHTLSLEELRDLKSFMQKL